MGLIAVLGLPPDHGQHLYPLWPADSRIESWVMDTGTPLTNRIGAQYISLPSMNLTSVLARPKGQEEYRLEGQMLQGGASLIGSKGVLAGARPVRSSRRVCHSCLWVCLWNYPGDERDFCPSWCWKENFLIYQQWVTYRHQWCWAVCQACISLLRLPEPRAKRETALKVKCFKEALIGSKWTLSAGAKNQGEVPGGGSPPAFGSVSVETIQETSEIFILTNIDGQISRLSAMADL